MKGRVFVYIFLGIKRGEEKDSNSVQIMFGYAVVTLVTLPTRYAVFPSSQTDVAKRFA
jgi:hypothetical protein